MSTLSLYQRMKNIIKKKCITCFFYQKGECVLYKNRITPCDMKVKKIKGVSEIEFYVNLVNSKKLSIRALYFSILSLIIACLSLLLNYFSFITR